MSDNVQLDRDSLVAAIMSFLANQPHLEEICRAIEAEIDAAGPEALAALNVRLSHAGTDWTFYAHEDRGAVAGPIPRRLFLAPSP